MTDPTPNQHEDEIYDMRVSIKALIEMDFDREERREILEQVDGDDFDAVSDTWRFIHEDSIDKIMQDELSNDEYVLGCFNANFLSEFIGLDAESIQILQANEGYEGLGRAVMNSGKLAQLQEAYAALDGYGHHFAHYDHETHALTLNGQEWYAFKIN